MSIEFKINTRIVYIKYLILSIVFISCEKNTSMKAIEYKKNIFPIQFLNKLSLKSRDGIDTFQIYFLTNYSNHGVYVKTVKNDGAYSIDLIKKIYEQEHCLKSKNTNEWIYSIGNNASVKSSIDSIFLSPNKSILFAMRDMSATKIDSMSYIIKIKYGNPYRDTLVRKKMRLYNNEKFVEDTAYWPAIEGVLKKGL